MSEPAPMSDDQVREFGINIVLDDIRKNGYAVSSITSDRNSNSYKSSSIGMGSFFHVIVRTTIS